MTNSTSKNAGDREGPMGSMMEMMPKIDPDKRGAAAAGILSKIIEKGSEGMSDEQAQAFRKALDEVVNPSK